MSETMVVEKETSSIHYQKQGIDIEISCLMQLLNQVPGLTTVESCFGHGEFPVYIWLKFDTIVNFNHFLWAMCYRYGCIGVRRDSEWHLVVDNVDTDYDSIELNLCLTSTKKGDDVLPEIASLERSLKTYLVAHPTATAKGCF